MTLLDINIWRAREAPLDSSVVSFMYGNEAINLRDIVDNTSSQNFGILDHYNPKDISLNRSLN